MTTTLTTAQAEEQVREFAAEFPTPNVLRGVALAKDGLITWHDMYQLCCSAMREALAEVAS